MEPAWRTRARRLFPHHARHLRQSTYSIYDLMRDLRSDLAQAHAQCDEETLIRIYSFTAWGLSQSDQDLSNAAGVAFYEHLFDPGEAGYLAVPWLSPVVIASCMGLWRWWLGEPEAAEIELHIAERTIEKYRLLHPDPGG